MANSFPSTLAPPSTFPLSKIVIELKLFILQLQFCLLLNVNSYLFSSLSSGWRGKKAFSSFSSAIFVIREVASRTLFLCRIWGISSSTEVGRREDNLVISNFNKIQFTLACNSPRQEATSPKRTSMIVSFSSCYVRMFRRKFIYGIAVSFSVRGASILGDISDGKVRVDRVRSAHTDLLRNSNPLKSASA